MVTVSWLCSPSLPSDVVDELGSAEPLVTLFSSGPDSELALEDIEEETDDAGTGGFFFLVFLMTPVLHLDFRVCL